MLKRNVLVAAAALAFSFPAVTTESPAQTAPSHGEFLRLAERQ